MLNHSKQMKPTSTKGARDEEQLGRRCDQQGIVHKI